MFFLISTVSYTKVQPSSASTLLIPQPRCTPILRFYHHITMAFELAHNFSSCHLIPQSSDLLLHPPEAYLFIQDFLIISCGILYALCYAFYMTRTYSDRYCAGTPLYLAGTMAYEVYYAVVTTTTRFERFAFFAWFLLDAAFACVAIGRAYPRAVRGAMASWLVAGVLGGVGMLRVLGWYWPDEREQVTAYWTGLALQLPIGWGSVVLLMKRGDTKGQSLEIW